MIPGQRGIDVVRVTKHSSRKRRCSPFASLVLCTVLGGSRRHSQTILLMTYTCLGCSGLGRTVSGLRNSSVFASFSFGGFQRLLTSSSSPEVETDSCTVQTSVLALSPLSSVVVKRSVLRQVFPPPASKAVVSSLSSTLHLLLNSNFFFIVPFPTAD